MQGHDVFVVDSVRTPIGKFGGTLAGERPDDLAAEVIRGLLAPNPSRDPARVDEIHFGAANGSGEDNRNVARMAALLAGVPPRGRECRLAGLPACVVPPGSAPCRRCGARSPEAGRHSPTST